MGGTNPKDIGGLPHLSGRELARARSANKLLLRMNGLMKDCGSNNVPFYMENPKSSKLWMHPIIRKWIQNKASHKAEFNYCQFGTTWKKSTTILSVGNIKFHTGKLMKCAVTWEGENSICSKTGKPHET